MAHLPSKTDTAKPLWQAKLEAATGKRVGTGDRSVVLLLDASGSMDEHAKLTKAGSGALAYAEDAGSRGFLVGLVVFASTARTVMHLQPYGDRFRAELSKIEADGSTDLAAGLRLADEELARSRGERVVCLITDGVPDDRKEALTAAERLKRRGVEIMAIGTDDADEEFLRLIVSRREFSKKVSRELLPSQISAMAALLPKPK